MTPKATTAEGLRCALGPAGGYHRASAAPVATAGCVAGSCVPGLPSCKQCSLSCHSHRLLQTALLLQSDEGKHERSESSPGIRLQSANSFSQGTIFKLQSICLRKVPSAACKYANSPSEEPQLRTARSSPGLPPLSRSSISLHNHTVLLQSRSW